MPRSRAQLEEAAARAEAWLDDLHSAVLDTPDADATTLRAVAAATDKIGEGTREQATAVNAARRAGRTWSEIAQVLGTSRQAAISRFGEPTSP